MVFAQIEEERIDINIILYQQPNKPNPRCLLKKRKLLYKKTFENKQKKKLLPTDFSF
jgi:hypothetical protein